MRCITFVLILAAGLNVFGQDRRREDQPLSDDLYRLYENRVEKLKRSIANSKSEWAGVYLSGDHHPTVLMLDPSEGFLVTSSLHTSSPSWINYGGAAFDRTSVILRPELPDDNKYAHRIDKQFRLVRWGKQHFLVPPEELLIFAYAVHSRSGSQLSDYFAKLETADVSRRGLPDLPAQYVKYMRMPPITARITKLVGRNAYGQTFELGAGKRHGIIPGMYLYHSSRSGLEFSLRVTDVQETTATAETAMMAYRDGKGAGRGIKVGSKVSSRMPVGFIEPG